MDVLVSDFESDFDDVWETVPDLDRVEEGEGEGDKPEKESVSLLELERVRE